MTHGPIHLKALKFGDSEGGPTRVVADFPAEILYTLARIHGAIPHIVLTPEAAQHSTEFYSFMTGYVANRFYEGGMDEAAPGYNAFSGNNVLASYEVGTKAPDSPPQQLAEELETAISEHLGEASAETLAERRVLATVLARTVVNSGWRRVTKIGR